MPSDENKPAGGSSTPDKAAAPIESPVLEDASLETPPEPPEPAADQPAAKQDKGQNKPSPLSLIKNNLWLLVFIIIIGAGAAVVAVTLKSSKPSTTVTKAGSLTDQQLATLKGNTTLVGDPKQTLDVQSNAIFEGSVLLRSDLGVAGSLKVGGPLSLPSITVGGGGTFGQVGISGGLNVGGDTNIQGQLSVQRNLTVSGSASFGSLNVSSLSVTTLALRGDINLDQHINTSGGVPGRTVGTAVGGGGTASVSGTDIAGTVNINTGSSPPAGCFMTINFTRNFSRTPHVVISPSNSSAAGLQYYTNRSSGSFSVCTASPPAASTNYIFDYVVIN